MSNAPNLSLIADGAIEPSVFVMASAAAECACKTATTGGEPIGVSQEWSKATPLPGASTVAAADKGQVGVYGIGRICYLTAGTAGVTHGDYLKPDTTGGAGVTATSGDLYGALCLQSGVAGSLVRVQVLPCGKVGG